MGWVQAIRIPEVAATVAPAASTLLKLISVNRKVSNSLCEKSDSSFLLWPCYQAWQTRKFPPAETCFLDIPTTMPTYLL
jgi:hypothetical protein